MRNCVILIFLLSASPRRADDSAPLQRIAFGSCVKQDKPQPIWDAIVETKPQLFLFLGDNIYADTEDMKLFWEKSDGNCSACCKSRLHEAGKQTCPILATWDDHDLGANDAGADYPKKKESQQLFLDFFDIPRDSPRRQQEGVYYSQTFGPLCKRVQILLLDTRYFRRSPVGSRFRQTRRTRRRTAREIPASYRPRRHRSRRKAMGVARTATEIARGISRALFERPALGRSTRLGSLGKFSSPATTIVAPNSRHKSERELLCSAVIATSRK